jgi:hypothetical protein
VCVRASTQITSKGKEEGAGSRVQFGPELLVLGLESLHLLRQQRTHTPKHTSQRFVPGMRQDSLYTGVLEPRVEAHDSTGRQHSVCLPCPQTTHSPVTRMTPGVSKPRQHART